MVISDKLIKRMMSLSRVNTMTTDVKVLVPFPKDSFFVGALHKYINKGLRVDTQVDGKYDLILCYHPFPSDTARSALISLYGQLKTNGRLLATADPSSLSKTSTGLQGWLTKVDACMEDLPVFELEKEGGKLLIIDMLSPSETQIQSSTNSNMKKLTIPREPLLKVLKKAKEVVSKHPTLSVLSNVLVRVLATSVEIIATDTIVTSIGSVDCTHEEPKPFSFLLPFDFFLDVVGLISHDNVTIETDLKSARITGVGDSYDIETLEAADLFPKMPEFPEELSLAINSDFVKWLNKALDTASADSQRPAMNKIYVGVDGNLLSLASTNSRILFERTFDIAEHFDGKSELLVNSTIVKALKGFNETEISWNDHHIAFKSDNITLIGTLQDEKYPNYKGVLPKKDTNVTFKRTELIDALEKANLTSGKEKIATLHLKKEIGFLVIDAWDVDKARKTVVRMPLDYNGPCDAIKFNPESLLKLLYQVDYDHISMAIHEHNKGVLVKSDTDPSYTGFIMPIY